MQDVLVWQLVDSAFPTGAFAHSLGLESAWQHGEVESREDLQAFTEAAVLQAASGTLPLVNAAYREPDRLAEWDALHDAFLTNAVANRASRVQGRTLVASASRIWPSPAVSRIQVQAASICAHVAPITGVVFRALGLPRETAQRIVLYGAARGVLSAAVRLGVTGSYDAQRLQSAVGLWSAGVAARYADIDEHDLAQTAPIVDVLQGAHDRLYSRLFQS